MDSTDLSLIEISGEDDSLLSLQQSPNDGVSLLNANTANTATNKTFFSLSPLLHLPRSIPSAARPPIPPSPIGSVNRESDASEPSSSSCKDGREGANKENVHVNKPEVAKLSLEPQQMKRKKKGGGFNMRKSLAWDRAFFTEEGVLDPSELSLLSGSVGKSSGGMLPVIEEGRESLCGGLDGVKDSPGLRALEEDLFKELPAKTPKKGKTIAGLLSPKPSPTSARKEAGSASLAKRKVLSAQDINRSASKRSGCPRPVASSLQRPLDLKRMNAPTRDSKVSKPLALKMDYKVTPVSSRTSTTTASQSKRSQIAQTATIHQKSIGLKGTSGNAKRSAQQDVKSVPSIKSTVKSTVVNARRNLLEQPSSIPGKLPLANAQHPHVSRTNSSLEAVPNQALPAVTQPSHGHGSNGKAGVSLIQSSSHSGVNMECAQSHIAKPSGLRRPSPSLGYFGQSKTSTQPFGSSQPSSITNSRISNLSKPGKLAHQRLPKPFTSIRAVSSKGCAAASVVSSAEEGKIKPNLGSNNMEKMEVQVPPSSSNCVMTSYPQQLPSIHDNVGLHSLVDAEPCKIEKYNLEDKGLQGNGNQLLVQNGPSEKLKMDDDCKQFTDSCLKSKGLSTAGLDYSLCKPHLDLQAEVEDRSVKSSMKFNHGFEARQNPSIRTNSVFPEVSDKSTSKVHEIRLSSMEGANKQSGEQDVLTKPDVCQVELVSTVDSQKQWMNNSTLFEQTKPVNAVELNLKVQDCSASKLECCYGPYNYNDIGNKNHSTNEVATRSRESQVGDAHQQSVNSNLSVECGKNNLTTSTVDNLHLMIIDGPNENNAEQVGIQDPCLVTVQAFEDNLGLHSNASPLCGTSFFSEDFLERDVLQRVKTVQSEGNNDCKDGSRVDESHMMEAVSTGTVEEYDVCGCSGDVVGRELEDHHVSQDPEVQFKVVSGVNGTSEGEDVIGRQDDSPVISSTVSCDLQPGIATCYDESGILIAHGANIQSLEQAGLINSCSPEVIQGNHNQNACADVLFGEGSFDSLKCYDGNIASSGHEFDISPGLQQCEIMEQANELAEVQSLDSSLLADGQNSKAIVVDKRSSSVLCNISECLEEHPHLQNPCPVVEEIPVELPDISSGNNSLHTDLYVESPKREVPVIVLANSCGRSDDCPSESAGLIVCNHGVDIDEADHQPVDEMMPSSEGIRSLAENVDGCINDKLGNDELSGDGTPLEHASSKKCEDRILSAFETSSEQLLVDPEDLSKTNLLPEEAEISVPESECPSTEHGSDKAIHPKENGETLSIDKSLNQKKPVALVIKPPANAVPFSEEWLAALEAAGEDILTMKGGAVQNSPPDKSLPEPSPWSPVRKKQNQEIGPFDCTKYTNSGIPPSASD